MDRSSMPMPAGVIGRRLVMVHCGSPLPRADRAQPMAHDTAYTIAATGACFACRDDRIRRDNFRTDRASTLSEGWSVARRAMHARHHAL